jgi:hypothetical protein
LIVIENDERKPMHHLPLLALQFLKPAPDATADAGRGREEVKFGSGAT